MYRVHYKKEVVGILPTTLNIEFKELVSLEKIEDIKDKVESIIFKYFDNSDDSVVVLDYGDESEINLDCTLNFRGICEYLEATNIEPEEENIVWEIDYEKIWDKIKKELKTVPNFETVSIFKNDYFLEVYPV